MTFTWKGQEPQQRKSMWLPLKHAIAYLLGREVVKASDLRSCLRGAFFRLCQYQLPSCKLTGHGAAARDFCYGEEGDCADNIWPSSRQFGLQKSRWRLSRVAGAEKEFQTAFALNPYDADSHRWVAFFVLLPRGREQEAMAEIDKALDLEPQWTILTFTKGLMLYFFHHYQEAARLLEPSLARDPTSVLLRIAIGRVYQQMGRSRDQALEQLNTPPYVPGGHVQLLTALAYTRAVGNGT